MGRSVRITDRALPGAAQRWLPRIPLACLLGMAAVQIALVYGAGLNPWKGGGFGMFATLDSGSARRLRVEQQVVGVRAAADGVTPAASSAWRRVALPTGGAGPLQVLAVRARQLPSGANLRAVAREVRRRQVAARAEPSVAAAAPAGRLRITVLRRRLDLDAKRMRDETLRRIEVPADAR